MMGFFDGAPEVERSFVAPDDGKKGHKQTRSQESKRRRAVLPARGRARRDGSVVACEARPACESFRSAGEGGSDHVGRHAARDRHPYLAIALQQPLILIAAPDSTIAPPVA